MSSAVRPVAQRRRREIGMRTRQRVSLTFKLAICLVTIVIAVLPVLYVVAASLNPVNSLVGQGLFPARLTLDNFERLFTNPLSPFPRWIFNSVVVSSVSAVIIVSLTALAAYSFSRFRYRGRRAGLITLVVVQLFPNMLAFVALFLLLQSIGTVVPFLGLNTLGGLILVYVGGALGFNTWLMKAYFDTVPYDLDESALVDGASHLQAFRHVVLPLVRPILAVITILSFIGTYSDFILARVLLTGTENYTLAVGLTLFIQGNYATEWGAFAAAALVGALPIMAMFLLLQRQLIGGLALGGVKG